MLMEAVLLLNLPKGLQEAAVAAVTVMAAVALVSFLEEAHHQGQGGALIVGLMVIGPATVKQVIGKTNVIDVENVVILKGTVKTVQKKPMLKADVDGVTRGPHRHLGAEEAAVVALAGVAATANRGHRWQRGRGRGALREGQEVQGGTGTGWRHHHRHQKGGSTATAAAGVHLAMGEREHRQHPRHQGGPWRMTWHLLLRRMGTVGV